MRPVTPRCGRSGQEESAEGTGGPVSWRAGSRARGDRGCIERPCSCGGMRTQSRLEPGFVVERVSHRRAPFEVGRASVASRARVLRQTVRSPERVRTSRSPRRSAGRAAPDRLDRGVRARSRGRCRRHGLTDRTRRAREFGHRNLDDTPASLPADIWRASLAAMDTSQGRSRSGSRRVPSLRQAIGQAASTASSARSQSPQMT